MTTPAWGEYLDDRRVRLNAYFREAEKSHLGENVVAAAAKTEMISGVPQALLLGLASAEAHARPAFIRTVETILLKLNLVASRFGLPIRNLSIGPLQIKLSTALRYSAVPMVGFRSTPDWISPPASRVERERLLTFMKSMVEIEPNMLAAAGYISALYENYCADQGRARSMLDANFVRHLAAAYSGRPENVHILAAWASAYPAVLVHSTRAFSRRLRDTQASSPVAHEPDR